MTKARHFRVYGGTVSPDCASSALRYLNLPNLDLSSSGWLPSTSTVFRHEVHLDSRTQMVGHRQVRLVSHLPVRLCPKHQGTEPHSTYITPSPKCARGKPIAVCPITTCPASSPLDASISFPILILILSPVSCIFPNANLPAYTPCPAAKRVIATGSSVVSEILCP
jgi:hypothetical protein